MVSVQAFTAPIGLMTSPDRSGETSIESWLIIDPANMPPRESRDHDHCDFCGEKFMIEDSPETLHAGWICRLCLMISGSCSGGR